MTLEGCYGECLFSFNSKKATIHILKKSHWDKPPHFPITYDDIVIHELLHLHFAMFAGEDVDSHVEQAIEALVKAFTNE